jgi:hypothetical protein
MEIADPLMHGHGPTAIAELTDLSVNYVKNRLGDLYRRFEIPEECDARVSLAVYIHSHRRQVGLTCLRCDGSRKAHTDGGPGPGLVSLGATAS